MAKKIAEFCPVCNKETTHREKRKSYKQKKRGETYVTITLPLKCLACNYLHGGRIKPKEKTEKFIKI